LGWGQLSDFEALREQFERKWGFAMWDWGSRMQQGVIHFHVWTQGEMIDLLKHVGLTILYVVDYVPERPERFVVFARKWHSGPTPECRSSDRPSTDRERASRVHLEGARDAPVNPLLDRVGRRERPGQL